jgi:hypothetical protein
MSLLEKFQTVTGDGWTTSGMDVQFKVVDRVLYFQCTHGVNDWRENFKAGKDVYPCSDIPFKAHDGFSELWLSVKEEIEKLEFDFICGYSQGSALAVFAHENYFHRKGVQPLTWAFGCPRVLYKPSSMLEARFTNFIRISNRFDIVTMVPLAIMGYRHIGNERILKSPVSRPSNVNLLEWLSNHSPSMYKLRLVRE